MGDKIEIELPDKEVDEVEEVEKTIADEVVIDEVAALREAERERVAADIIAAAELAKAAHDLATSAHSRIDDHNSTHTLEVIEEIAEAQAEAEAEAQPVTEIEVEPEKKLNQDGILAKWQK